MFVHSAQTSDAIYSILELKNIKRNSIIFWISCKKKKKRVTLQSWFWYASSTGFEPAISCANLPSLVQEIPLTHSDRGLRYQLGFALFSYVALLNQYFNSSWWFFRSKQSDEATIFEWYIVMGKWYITYVSSHCYCVITTYFAWDSNVTFIHMKI